MSHSCEWKKVDTKDKGGSRFIVRCTACGGERSKIVYVQDLIQSHLTPQDFIDGSYEELQSELESSPCSEPSIS